MTGAEIRRKEAWSRVTAAIEKLQTGGMILVRDNEDRENEGDIICAADGATEKNINFMVTHGRGLVCMAVTEETARRLELNPMVERNSESLGTAFTVSVDAQEGATTGISVADRVRTVQVILDTGSVPADLRRPGHLFPLIARPGGVFERTGHTEAAVDLARLAGMSPAGVICEVLNDDGLMARGAELESMAARYDMPLISVEDLILYRDSIGDVTLETGPEARLPRHDTVFTVQVYRSSDPAAPEAVLLSSPGSAPHCDNPAPLVRIHSECLTGDVLGSTRCDCGAQLSAALDRIGLEGGYLIYLRQEGRGIGLFDKIRAYTLQDKGLDTVDANLRLGHPPDGRRFGTAAALLGKLGVRKIRLLTNNPEKEATFLFSGIDIIRREPLIAGAGEDNRHYLQTKRERMGHLLPLS